MDTTLGLTSMYPILAAHCVSQKIVFAPQGFLNLESLPTFKNWDIAHKNAGVRAS